ncbi:MAG TPA: hypothetical protein VF743_02910, partial [Acidimicrobiales bacterium]
MDLRRRVRALAVLAPSDEPWDDDHLFLTAAGVHLDDATRRAASTHAREHGLDVVDLVPRDLPVERLVEVLRLVDPATFRTSRLALERGPAQAMLLTKDVLHRSGIGEIEGLDPGTFALAAENAKKAAPTTTDLAV